MKSVFFICINLTTEKIMKNETNNPFSTEKLCCNYGKLNWIEMDWIEFSLFWLTQCYLSFAEIYWENFRIIMSCSIRNQAKCAFFLSPKREKWKNSSTTHEKHQNDRLNLNAFRNWSTCRWYPQHLGLCRIY